jgi:hypothetical protein
MCSCSSTRQQPAATQRGGHSRWGGDCRATSGQHCSVTWVTITCAISTAWHCASNSTNNSARTATQQCSSTTCSCSTCSTTAGTVARKQAVKGHGIPECCTICFRGSHSSAEVRVGQNLQIWHACVAGSAHTPEHQPVPTITSPPAWLCVWLHVLEDHDSRAAVLRLAYCRCPHWITHWQGALVAAAGSPWALLCLQGVHTCRRLQGLRW